MNNAWLTIIVAAYNTDAYIAEALLSALDQIDEHVEIIVVNDGSKDNTLAEIGRVINTHPRGHQVMVIDQENRGLSESRNIGISHANGRYIGFLDGDDVLLPDFYRKVSHAISAASCEPDIVEFNALRFSRCVEGEYQDSSPFGINLLGDYSGKLDEQILYQVFSHAYWFSWARIYKKTLFDGLPFPATLSYEDMMTTPQLYLRSACIAGIEAPLIGYRMNLGGITRNPSVKNLQDIETVIDHYLGMSATEPNHFYKKLLLLVACQGTLFYKSISNDMKGYFKSVPDISRVVKKVNSYKAGVDLDIPFNTKMLFMSPFMSNVYSYFKQLV